MSVPRIGPCEVSWADSHGRLRRRSPAWSRLALESASGTRLLWRSPAGTRLLWRSPAGTRPLWRSPAGTRLEGRGLPRCLERSWVPGQPTRGPLLRHSHKPASISYPHTQYQTKVTVQIMFILAVRHKQNIGLHILPPFQNIVRPRFPRSNFDHKFNQRDQLRREKKLYN